MWINIKFLLTTQYYSRRKYYWCPKKCETNMVLSNYSFFHYCDSKITRNLDKNVHRFAIRGGEREDLSPVMTGHLSTSQGHLSWPVRVTCHDWSPVMTGHLSWTVRVTCHDRSGSPLMTSQVNLSWTVTCHERSPVMNGHLSWLVMVTWQNWS